MSMGLWSAPPAALRGRIGRLAQIACFLLQPDSPATQGRGGLLRPAPPPGGSFSASLRLCGETVRGSERRGTAGFSPRTRRTQRGGGRIWRLGHELGRKNPELPRRGKQNSLNCEIRERRERKLEQPFPTRKSGTSELLT
jgi:hypothetical protein